MRVVETITEFTTVEGMEYVASPDDGQDVHIFAITTSSPIMSLGLSVVIPASPEVSTLYYQERMKEFVETSIASLSEQLKVWGSVNKNRTWKPQMTDKESKEIAYYERNMLALRYADGWYFDTENNWEGWKRVLSLDNGKLTFHIPDDFNVGNLKEIKPNWDGHSTEEKWQQIDALRGILP